MTTSTPSPAAQAVSDEEVLFSPLRVGALLLRNRIIMAPLTRMRAGASNVPTALNVDYYAQRASAGLIIAEGTAISSGAHGYVNAPGIYTARQISGWRSVTDAVHALGGVIVLQIQHNGRNSHTSLIPGGELPVAPSAIPPNIPALTSTFERVAAEIPRALETREVPDLVTAFGRAAENAIKAGFDGVELQAANSHLIDQFLEDGTNQRTDQYGASIENRSRFLLESVDRIAGAIGPERLGVRLSPFGQYGGISESHPHTLFEFVIRQLSDRRLAYLHLIEARGSEIGLTDELHANAPDNAAIFGSMFDGPLVSAAAYTPSTAALAISQHNADAIAFGRLFIANPDLVERINEGQPLNAPNRSTFYGGDERGYTDYPSIEHAS